MQKPYLLLSILLISFFISGYCLIPRYVPVKNESAIKSINGKYILRIDQSTIGPLKDTLMYGRKFSLTRFALTLTNNTSDTLKYVNMSCEWWAIYHISNKNVNNVLEDCLKNIPEVFTLPPHQTDTIKYPVLIEKSENVHGQKFMIGMNIVKHKIPREMWNSSLSDELRSRNNLTWSNEVVIP